MDDSSANKSNSLETLVIQNITNVNDLKSKLNDIIKTGKDYEYDVSSCLKTLLGCSNPEIVALTVQAISELAKCENKRLIYAEKDIIEPILNILDKEITLDRTDIMKQCCRSLGNLCCDCDTSRKIILESNGIPILITFLENTFKDNSKRFEELKILTSKTLLNFSIGGQEFSEAIVQGGLVVTLYKIMIFELDQDDMNDDMLSTALLILNVINENSSEFMFEPEVNTAVLNVLRETTNIEISELCLDHLHTQAEHDSVKTLIAKENGLQLVCTRLEQLVQRLQTGELNAEDAEIEAIMKQACDLIIIVLTGDEAMHTLYNNGLGEIYITMVQWLESTNNNLLTTAVLAIGNFARQDDYCTQMMNDKIFDKLLDIFEEYHGFSVRMEHRPPSPHPYDPATVTRIQHAVVSALRNLSVPRANKRVAAARGRAAPALLRALPHVRDHHVAYKLLAAIRMLVDGQAAVALQLMENRTALDSVARWGRGEHTGAAGEAPRLLAWAMRLLRHRPHCTRLVQAEGCVSSLVNMVIACHSVMQNEAILALTLLSLEVLGNAARTGQADCEYEQSFIDQMVQSEIGKHVSVLIDTNSAKMPVEVAENLLAFLNITAKKTKLALDYKEAKVHESLQKFMDARSDFSNELKTCILGVVTTISDSGQAE